MEFLFFFKLASAAAKKKQPQNQQQQITYRLINFDLKIILNPKIKLLKTKNQPTKNINKQNENFSMYHPPPQPIHNSLSERK